MQRHSAAQATVHYVLPCNDGVENDDHERLEEYLRAAAAEIYRERSHPLLRQ